MSDRQKLMESTKKEISSLLVGLGAARDKPGIPMKQFHNDYKDMVGSCIPYRELGYSNLEDFFRDITDTVQLQWGRDTSEALVKLVENESISHIVSLVNAQRTTASALREKKRRKNAAMRGSGGYYNANRFSTSQRRGRYEYEPRRPAPSNPKYADNRQRFRSNAPPRMAQMSNIGSRWSPPKANSRSEGLLDHRQKESDRPPLRPVIKTQAPIEPRPQPQSVSPLTRGMIKELLLSYPNGLLGEDIGNAYSKRFGHGLNPQSMGFKNIYSLFCSLSDLIDITELDEDFRVSQKRLRPINIRTGGGDGRGDGPRKTSDRKPTERTPSPVIVEEASPPSTSKRKVQDYLYEQLEEAGPSKTLVVDIKQVLADHRYGIWTADFGRVFERVIGVPLPWKDLGYPSVIDLMNEMSKDVVIVRESPRDWKLYSIENAPSPQTSNTKTVHTQVQKPPSPDIFSVGSSGSMGREISEDIKESVRQVLNVHPEGLPLYELPDTYRMMTGKILPVKEIGFPQVELLVQRLNADNVLDMHYQGKGLVLLKPTAPTETFDTSFLLNRPGLGKHQRVPEDAVGAGVQYPDLKFPDWEPGTFDTEVYVSMVNDPSYFWIQLRGPSTTLALENLMDELEVIYESRDANQYAVPDYLLTEGQVCVARYPNDNNWHRVSIVKSVVDFVSVYFVDYGTTCSVHRETLRLLKTRFLHLPAQAIRAKLTNIRPYAGAKMWSPRATQRMLELTSNHPVLCSVFEIDNDKTLSVCLCDTSGVDDIHIQDLLVEERLAELADAPEASTPELSENVTESDRSAADDLNMSRPDNVAFVSPMKRGTESWDGEESCDPMLPCTKLIELTSEYSVHIIKYLDLPYILSAEISAFFWDKDLLRSMLRQKRIELNRIVLPHDENEAIFDELKEHGVGAIYDSTSQIKSHITIYPLDSVLQILEVFGNTNSELKQAIERERDTFNPNDEYWKDETEEEDEELRSCSEVTSDGSQSYKAEELELAITAIQQRKTRICRAMINPVDPEGNKARVEEIGILEKQISELTAILDRKNRRTEIRANEELLNKGEEEKFLSDKEASSKSSSKKHGSAKGKGTKAVMIANSKPLRNQTNDPTFVPLAAANISTSHVPVNQGVMSSFVDKDAAFLQQYHMLLQQNTMFQNPAALMSAQNANLLGANNPMGAQNANPMGAHTANFMGAQNANFMGANNAMGGFNMMGMPNVTNMGANNVRYVGAANAGNFMGAQGQANMSHPMPRMTQNPMSGMMPGMMPNAMPGMMPNSMPGMMPNSMPGMMPNSMPGMMPTSMPGMVPTSMPGMVPTSMPGMVPTSMAGFNSMDSLSQSLASFNIGDISSMFLPQNSGNYSGSYQ